MPWHLTEIHLLSLPDLLITKKLAFKPQSGYKSAIPCGSYPCGSCALCGGRAPYKGHSMVIETQKIVSKTNGRSYSIKQHLTCKSYGNYVAPCLIENCGHQYVGQTKNEYRLRWNGHRQKLTKNILDDQKGEAALNKHFVKYHADRKSVV